MMLPNIKRAKELIAENKRAKATFLDLGNLGLEEWPEELWELDHLEVLNLGVSYYVDREDEISNSKNLFRPNSFRTIPDALERLTNLRVLSFSNYLEEESTSLWFSDFHSSLGRHQCGNRIYNVSILAKLSQLQHLELNGNQISKLENLEGLSQLQYLNLSNNQISKLENLEGLSQLQSSGTVWKPDKQAGKFGRAVAIAVIWN